MRALLAQLAITGFVTSAAAADLPPPAHHTECLTADYCLCITDSFQAMIEQKIKTFQDAIHAAHTDGRLAIYLSVPLSGNAGAYFPLNREVANDVAEQVSKRFGSKAVWILNPSTPDADLPKGATQSDYLYLWARTLYGAEHAGDGVDLIYFTGTADFARHLRLTGANDIEFLGQYFDHRAATDPTFADAIHQGKLVRRDFLAYYGFRASTAFSAGAHDEWNLAGLINRERRASDSTGIIRQLPVMFDGSAVAPPLYDAAVPAGNVGKCH